MLLGRHAKLRAGGRHQLAFPAPGCHRQDTPVGPCIFCPMADAGPSSQTSLPRLFYAPRWCFQTKAGRCPSKLRHRRGPPHRPRNRSSEIIPIKPAAAKESDEPGNYQGAADFSHQIADALFPKRIRSLTMRQRLTRLLTGSLRSRRCAAPGSPFTAPVCAPRRVASWLA